MKYYSVSDMAEMLGITTQGVRSRIKTRQKEDKKFKFSKFDFQNNRRLYSEEQFEVIKKDLHIGRKKKDK